MKQNEDFELIPHGNDSWAIRILKGAFVETEYEYGALQLEDNGELRYAINILKTPRENELTEDLEFQSLTGDILFDIMAEIKADTNNNTK